MRPQEVLANQHDLYVRMSSNPVYREVIAGALRSPYVANRRTVPQFFVADHAVNRLATWAQAGMAIEVTDHMTDLITWVAAEMHGTDQVVIDSQPAPYGLVHFEKPLRVRDVRGATLHLSWMLWGPVPLHVASRPISKAVGVVGFADLRAPDEEMDAYVRDLRAQDRNGSMFRAMGQWVYTSFTVLADGDRVGPTFNEPLPELANMDPDWHGDLTGSTNVTRLVQALWTVMNEPISDVTEHHVDRATKRRMERMKIPPAVTVITLRRPANPHQHDEESHVEWQHHWIVRGHPRWQPYGPGRQERRLIWIGPHVKGNLDAPLKQSEKVYRVAR